jgi:aminoglycoside 6'-N-acetyltransferase
MNISFQPLQEIDFPLLLKWLQSAHVKKWWDREVNWTQKLIKEKYSDYVKGYKKIIENNKEIKLLINAFIICLDVYPIGYIQYYNKHDFPFEYNRDEIDLPKNCAGFDWYIGEEKYIAKGLGPKILETFINNYIFKNFANVIADSEINNIAAIKCYEKVGFEKIKQLNNSLLMLKENK